MSLIDFVVDRRQIRWPNDEGQIVCEVRGLSVVDIVNLFHANAEQLKGMFDGTAVDFAKMIVDAPVFVASMIAMAADELGDETIEKVQKMPFGLQLKILSEVWDLTAVSASDLGNVLAALMSSADTLIQHIPSTVVAGNGSLNPSPGTGSSESVKERAARLGFGDPSQKSSGSP